MSDTLPALFGTETENPLEVVWHEDYQDEPPARHHLLAYFFPRYITERTSLGFLANGGRVYDDMDFIESCTREVTTLDDLIIAERANEYLLNTFFTTLAAHGIIKSYRMRKRVLDDMGNTWAYHENHLYRRGSIVFQPDKEDGKGTDLLACHWSTRGIFTGAGGIYSQRYIVAQKALRLERDIASATTHNKPLINTRDAPYADDSKYGRLHNISGDAHISDWATRMQIGTTNLILRMIEQGETAEALRIAPGKAHLVAKKVAQDNTFAQVFAVESGRYFTAMDMQEELMSRASIFCSKEGASNDDKWVLAEWEKACMDIREDPARLCYRSDVATRRSCIEETLGRYSLGLDALSHPEKATRIRALKIATATSAEYETVHQYDPKRPDKTPMGQKIRQKIEGIRLPDEGDIYERMRTAPEGTRGWARGQAIARRDSEIRVLWHQLYFPQQESQPAKTIHLYDPYSSEGLSKLP